MRIDFKNIPLSMIIIVGVLRVRVDTSQRCESEDENV